MSRLQKHFFVYGEHFPVKTHFVIYLKYIFI